MPDLNSFLSEVLRRNQLPVTPQNIASMLAWQRAEGGWTNNTAAFNPLNTTRGKYPVMPGGNVAGVKAYPDYATGVQMTAETLGLPFYEGIRSALSRSAPVSDFAQAVYASPWGTRRGIAGVQPGAYTAAPASSAGPAPPSSGARLPHRPIPWSAFLAVGQADPGARTQHLLQMLAQRQPRQQAPAPQLPPSPSFVGATVGGDAGTPGGIRELFYDPLGAYDEGRWISPIGGHDRHVHASFGTPQAAIAGIRLAQQMGLTPHENPYLDAVNPGSHTDTSYHYKNFPGLFDGRTLGQGLDVYGDPAKMASYFNALVKRYGLR